jgi:hypothetical protein
MERMHAGLCAACYRAQDTHERAAPAARWRAGIAGAATIARRRWTMAAIPQRGRPRRASP